MSACKVLVIGAVRGNLRACFTKMAAIHKKSGPFTFAICLGDLFDNVQEDELDELVNGRIPVPLECYTTLAGNALPSKVIERVGNDAGEICPNLILLGKQGVFTTSHGLRIATFGGKFDLDKFAQTEESSDSPLSHDYFTSASHASFLTSMSSVKSAAGSNIDILLTHAWPSQITVHASRVPVAEDVSTWGSPAITDVVKATRPRYHFASEHPIFWERQPFTWPPGVSGIHSTRFISLGDFANAEKLRWFYAFKVTPATSEVSKATPSDVTPCPFEDSWRGIKRPSAEDGAPNFIFDESHSNKRVKSGQAGERRPPPDHYVCKICNVPGHWIQDCEMSGPRNARKLGTAREIGPDECWFCLSNPKLTKHLIASIGSEVYVTLPKGQLPDTTKPSSPVPGGGHVLLIPIGHFATFATLPPDQLKKVVAEIDSFKDALRKCYDAYEADLVALEISKPTGKGGHAHIQICPIPRHLSAQIEPAFRKAADQHGYIFVDESAADNALQTGSYFRVDLSNDQRLVCPLPAGQPFNLQFGRSVLALVLGTPERADWKACATSQDEEKAECAEFKTAFATFDPTMQF